jgi:branched-chain amino acid aminotransferase
MGGMNLFFVWTDRGSDPGGPPLITTPPLTGTLLPGITRDSLLRLAPDLGVTARQERISIEQWQAQCASGELTEVFACGTAAVITPVGRVKGESAEWIIADGATSSSASSTGAVPIHSAGCTRSARPCPVGRVPWIMGTGSRR